MTDDRNSRGAQRGGLLAVGITGFVLSALCCFTPVLVWTLAGLGLAALTGYLDIVLFPAMAVFAAITGYAIWKRSRR